jgi:inner membrane transporter RhtA
VNATPWHSAALVMLSSTSLQAGLAIAATAFVAAGPATAVWIRSVVGAALLVWYIRPNFRGFTRAQLGPIAVYGFALAAMTLLVYVAISGAPLGVVSAILMLAPLAIATRGGRTPLDLALVGMAGVGALTLTLAGGLGENLEAHGVLAAFGASIAFGAYIVAGKRVAQRVDGLGGLALALIIAAVLQTPLGILFARPGTTDPGVLVSLAAAGVLCTLIPFSLEAIALRRLSMATFGLLLAFEPAIAAIAGVVIRGDTLLGQQVLGIVLIIAAAAGSLGPRGWTRRLGSYNRGLMADPKIQALGRVPLFAGLSARDLSIIAQAATEQSAEAGTVLTREGDEGDAFFIVRDGTVSITAEGRHLRQLGPGDYLGEIALVFGGTRTATATVEQPAELFVLDKSSFTAMLQQHPRIEDRILGTISERMRYR